jgi:hypothetical protein
VWCCFDWSYPPITNALLGVCLSFTARRLADCLDGDTRTFATTDAADPTFNFYVRPKISLLLTQLLSYDFVLLTGHRQAGKTTITKALLADIAGE